MNASAYSYSMVVLCVLLIVLACVPASQADSCTNYDSNMGATYDISDLQR